MAMASSWSQLPPEILQLFLERLPLPDCLTFGKVCPSWRSVYNERRRLTRPPPCMLLRPYPRGPSTGTLWGLHDAQLLKLSSPVLNLHPRERILGSSLGWLVIAYTPTVVISRSEGVSFSPSLHLLNPISNERIPLPGYSGTLYHVALSTDPRSRDCVLVMSVCIDDRSISFAWCRPADLKWTSMDVGFLLPTGSGTGRMTFHNSKLYVVGHKEEFHIFAFDPQPNKIGTGSFASISESRDWFKKQMVQSGAELLLLGWSHPKNIDSADRSGHVMLDVFQQAEESDRWVRVESLGDRVLLMGKNVGITLESFCTRDLMGSGFEPNCIYFPHSPTNDESLVKFSVADGSSQRIHIPLTDQEHAFLADVEWIVPQEWTRATHSGSLADSNLPHISFWMPPPPDFVKVNFDAEIYKDSASASYGIVVRNHLGHVVICKFGRCAAKDSSSAEGSALLYGMELASLLKLERVTFECHNEMLITWLKFDKSHPPRSASGIIKSCKKLAAKFDKCSFAYIRREGNEAARGLTLLARSDQCPYVDTDVTCLVAPDGISDVICADLANVSSGGANGNVAGEDSSSSGDGEDSSSSDDDLYYFG